MHEVCTHVLFLALFQDEGASALLSLELLSVVMQVALHREALHWVLHNGQAQTKCTHEPLCWHVPSK